MVYPEIESAQRKWQPEAQNHADIQRVYDFLAKKTYNRKVSGAGQIGIFARKHSLVKCGKHLKGKFVQVKFNQKTIEWDVFHNYELITSLTAKEICKQNIENLSVMSKNKSD